MEEFVANVVVPKYKNKIEVVWIDFYFIFVFRSNHIGNKLASEVYLGEQPTTYLITGYIISVSSYKIEHQIIKIKIQSIIIHLALLYERRGPR